ncbi:hypothetical protein [Streptomyces sp. MAR4 CNX-425]|uniref:hypothetical protein n=1 Tax=Streptomyces sp. MAR4 CNX-425 TaxID=3406343 RepID=UPI003B515266
MSNPYQQQPGPGGTPGQQPYGAPGQQPPGQQPFGAPGQQPYSAPPPYAQQPPPRAGNPALAVGVAIVAAIVAAVIYAFILKALFDDETGEITKISYASIAVGALVGVAIGKLGGRNVGLWVVGGVLALLAVFAGEMYGYAMITSEVFGDQLSTTTILTDHFGDLFKDWREDAGGMTWVFMALSPLAAVGISARLSNNG